MLISAAYAAESIAWKAALISIGTGIFVAGVAYAVKLEHDAGYYGCPNCCTRYVPTMQAVAFAPHFCRTRKMKCPHCGEKAYHKKVLTK